MPLLEQEAQRIAEALDDYEDISVVYMGGADDSGFWLVVHDHRFESRYVIEHIATTGISSSATRSVVLRTLRLWRQGRRREGADAYDPVQRSVRSSSDIRCPQSEPLEDLLEELERAGWVSHFNDVDETSAGKPAGALHQLRWAGVLRLRS